MMRYQHLRDVHPMTYTDSHERGYEVGLSRGCQRDGEYRCSGRTQSRGSREDDAERRCNAAMDTGVPTPRRTLNTSKRNENSCGATGTVLLPHVSFSPISLNSPQASAITYGAAESATATVSSASAPKAFYDGPTLHDSIPALLARFTSSVVPSPSRTPTSTHLFELAMKADTLEKETPYLSARWMGIPQRSGSRHSRELGGAVPSAGQRKVTAEALAHSPGSSSDVIPQGTTHPEGAHVSRYEAQQPNGKGTTNRRMFARAEIQNTYRDAPPSAVAVVSETAQQRPVAAHIMPSASETSAQMEATAVVPEPAARHAVELTPRCCSVASSHGSTEETLDVCSASGALSSSSLTRPGSLRPTASPRRRRQRFYDNAEAVAGEERKMSPEASKGTSGTASKQPLPSMKSASVGTQKRVTPSRMRGLFDFVLSSSGNSGAGIEHSLLDTSCEGGKTSPECSEGVSSHISGLHPRKHKRSHTIASPLSMLQPKESDCAPSCGILRRDESVIYVDPLAAAVQETGDPLALQQRIDRLLSKVRRMEKENQRFWWQLHNWDPHRALEPNEANPIAAPLNHRCVRNFSSSTEAVARTPYVIPSGTVVPPQTQDPPGSQSCASVKWQRCPSHAADRSASCTSASFLSQEGPRCSRRSEGTDAKEDVSAHPVAHLCTTAVSSPSSAADTLIPPSTGSTRAAVASAVPRAERGVQYPSATRSVLTDVREHRSPVHIGLARMAEVAGAATEALQSVCSPSHADANAQTELVTPPSALLQPPEAHHQALHHRLPGTSSGNGRGTPSASSIASTARSRRNIDSEHSLVSVETDVRRLLSFPQEQQQRQSLSSCSGQAHTKGVHQVSGCFVSHARYPTCTKQVQTASIQLPSLNHMGDVAGGRGDGDISVGSTVDRTTSVLPLERSAVIEIHTSASYTQSTVRRLQEYCNSLEATRQQLRRRLSRSAPNSHDVSAAGLSPAQLPSSLPHSPLQAPLSPLATAAPTLNRPFFTSEYADPEIDAILHDVNETSALGTMIVLHEDGAGTITKRMIDGSESCISSFVTHSPASQSQPPAATIASSLARNSQTPVSESVTSWVRQHSPRPLRRITPQQPLPHHSWDTHDIKAVEDSCARRHTTSLRSDVRSSGSVSVLHVDKPMRSAFPSSWNASDVNVYFPKAVSSSPSRSTSPSKDSPSIQRFVVPSTTPFEGSDAEHLPLQPLPSRPHNYQTNGGASVLVTRAGFSEPEQFTRLQTGVTSSTTRASSRVSSQRFAVKGMSRFVSPKEYKTRNRSMSSHRSADSEALVSRKHNPSFASVDAAAAPLRDPTHHASQDSSPVMPSSCASASAAASLVASDLCGTTSTMFGSGKGVRRTSNVSVHWTQPVAMSFITTVANASLSPLSAPESDSEVLGPSAETEEQSHIRWDDPGSGCRSDRYKNSLHVRRSVSPAPSTPRDPEQSSDGRCKRSTTTVFMDDVKREASPVLSVRPSRVSVQLPLSENDLASPTQFDNLHSRNDAVSPHSSAETATSFPLPAQLEPSLRLQPQHPPSQRVISPSPPRKAGVDGNAENGDHGAESKAISTVSTTKNMGVDSTSSRSPLVLPQHHPPVAPPRVIISKEGSPSSDHSSLSGSLHSFPSTLSDEHCDDASDDGGDEDRAV